MRLSTGGPISAGKVVLRRVLDRCVPRHLVERPKSGFGVPIGTWLRGPLREWAEDVLSQERLQRQGLLDPLVVRGVWDDHVSGRRNAEHELWTVLMLHAWLEHGERRRTDHVSCDPQPLLEPIHPGG
jgi:asparagine synthase (glutamine-hydrolysing)